MSELIGKWYDAQRSFVCRHHFDLVRTLDVMPCDYRYFREDENPLDKLVEAASMREEMEGQMREVCTAQHMRRRWSRQSGP